MTVYERITEHLESEGCEYYEREDKGAVAFTCGSEELEDTLDCIIHVDEDSYVITVLFPFECEKNCLNELAILLAQINCGMWMGNFDIDFDDGQIAFRCFMSAMDALPSDEQIGTAIVSAVKNVELNFDDIHAVATGMQTAHDAIYAGGSSLTQ